MTMVRTETRTREDLVSNIVEKLPYPPAELTKWLGQFSNGILEHLADSTVPELIKIYREMRRAQIDLQRDPEIIASQQRVLQAQTERILAGLFHRYQISDCQAHRKALYDRALSLSDGVRVSPAHLEEAAKLLISEHAIKQERIPTAAERHRQQAQDAEAFKQAARQHGFSANTANEKLVETLGSGFTVEDIAEAISSNRLQLAPVGSEEQEQRDENERQEILEEIIGGRIITPQDKIKFQSMPLEQLRTELVGIREERRLRGMTGSELRAHIRSQHIDRTEKLPADYTKDQLLLIIEGNPQEFKDLCRRYGWKAIEERVGGYADPKIAGVVHNLRHEFDAQQA
jgi:hypothetical protein